MKIAIIVCWFGKLPDYFKFWEYSCKYNSEIDFFLITDNKVKTEIKNIKVINMSLKDIENKLKYIFEMNIEPLKPYKMCDLRPIYGIIFNEYLEKYDFWGNCDIDLIWGKISDFIDDEILEKYEKILECGHLTLYRNNKKMNNLFKENGGIYDYRDVILHKENYAFDEKTGIARIAKKNKIKTFCNVKYADIDVRYSRYRLCSDNNYDEQVFYWEDGEIIRAYIENNKVRTDKFCYLHFQKKHPIIKVELNEKIQSFYITKEGISIKDHIGVPSMEEIKKKAPFEGKKIEKLEEYRYIFKKIKQFMSCSNKQKKIWFKQKINK